MNTKVFLKKQFISEDAIDDEALLLVVMLASEFAHNDFNKNIISLSYLSKLIASEDNLVSIQKNFKKSLNQLVSLGIIKYCEQMERGYYQIDTTAFYFDKKNSFCKIYLSDIIAIMQSTNKCNKYKMVRLYLAILSSMDFTDHLPSDYKNKVYHFGIRKILNDTGLDKKTYNKYIQSLSDNKIIFCAKGRKDGALFDSCFISRYKDKELCEKFAISGGKLNNNSVGSYQCDDNFFESLLY